MSSSSFKSLLRSSPDPEFAFIDPPFNFNRAGVASHPPEVTGYFLLNSLCRRLGWPSLSGKRLLDYGCGVRFARTLVNLGIDIGLYAGVDVNRESIAWLESNVKGSRFRFEALNIRNQMYNPNGAVADKTLLTGLGLSDFDAACMFSVITHQNPDEAEVTFAMLRESVRPGGDLYFTALVDPETPDYREATPDKPGLHSAYNPDLIVDLVERHGWLVRATYETSKFQQSAFRCQ